MKGTFLKDLPFAVTKKRNHGTIFCQTDFFHLRLSDCLRLGRFSGLLGDHAAAFAKS